MIEAPFAVAGLIESEKSKTTDMLSGMSGASPCCPDASNPPVKGSYPKIVLETAKLPPPPPDPEPHPASSPTVTHASARFTARRTCGSRFLGVGFILEKLLTRVDCAARTRVKTRSAAWYRCPEKLSKRSPRGRSGSRVSLGTGVAGFATLVPPTSAALRGRQIRFVARAARRLSATAIVDLRAIAHEPSCEPA